MAIAPVVINFLAQGVPQVQQAFKSIQDSAMRAERAQTASAERGTKVRISAAQREARERIKAAQAAEKDLDKWQRRQVQTTQRAEQQKQRIHESAAQREARSRIRAAQAAEKDLDRWQKKEIQILERAEQKKKAIHDRETKARSQAARHADIQNRIESRARERLARDVIGAGARGVISGMQRVGNVSMGLAQTTAQLGGGFSIADSMQKQLGAQRLAANIVSSTITQKVTQEEILKAARPVSIATGTDLESVVGGIEAFRKPSGDTRRGMEMIPQVAKLATVFNADLEKLSENAGVMAMSGDMSNDDIMSMLRVQAYQGSVGSVELPDFTRYGRRVTTAARMFGGDRAENIGALGAAAQIAMQSGAATTPAEATMSALRITTDIAKKHDLLKKKFGIETIGEDGKTLKSLPAIVSEMMEKTGGRVDKVTQLGIGDRGDKFLQGAAAIYRDAGGGEAGQKALQKEWDKFTGKVVDPTTGKKVEALSDNEVNRRFDERMSKGDKQFEKTLNELRNYAGEQLLPLFEQMLPVLKDLIPAFVDVAKVGIPAFTDFMKGVAAFATEYKGIVQGVAAHPVGALIALELTKSFAAAGLPSLLARLLTSVFAKAPGGVPGVPGTAGAPGSSAGAALGAGVAAGAATYMLARPGVDAALEGQVQGQVQTGALIATLKNGSKKDKTAALAQIETMKARYGGASGALELFTGAGASAVGGIYSAVTGDKNPGAEGLSKAVAAREILDNEELKQLVVLMRQQVQATQELKGGAPQVNNAARSEPILPR